MNPLFLSSRSVSISALSRTTHSARVVLTAALSIAVASPLAAQTLVVGSFDRTRACDTNLVDGPLTRHIHESLAENIERLGFNDFQMRGTDELSMEFLSTIDFLLVHNACDLQNGLKEDLSEFERDSLLEFVLQGGAAFILVDGFFTQSANQLAAPFGLQIKGFTTGRDEGPITAPEHAVTDGPFGVVRDYTTWFAGWFEEVAPPVRPLITLSTGQPSFVVIDAGALDTGSGRVAMTTDLNPYFPCIDPERFFFCTYEPLFLNAIAWLTEPSVGTIEGPGFRRGDANGDGTVNLSDAVSTLETLFQGGPAFDCPDAADADNDGGVNLTDPVYTLNYLFGDGPPPPAPGPTDCGPDPENPENPESERLGSCVYPGPEC